MMAPKLRFSHGLKAKVPGAVTACIPTQRRHSSKFLQAHPLNSRSNDGDGEDFLNLRGSFKCMIAILPTFWRSAPALKFSWHSGRLTSGSRPGQAVPSPFCQRSKDEGKLRPKFTKCEKVNIFEHATGFRPPVAMEKPKWRQILLSLTLFSNVTSKEGKPMSCACSVFIPVKRMGVCNFSPMG